MRIMKWRWMFFVFSGLLLIGSVVSLIMNGIRPAIDFTGGTLLEVKSELLAAKPSQELVTLVKDSFEVSVASPTQNQTVIFRGQHISNEQKVAVLDQLREIDPDIEELRFDTIGPTFGVEILRKMITAVAIVAAAILFYVWFQFSAPEFGVAAVLAMFHDSLIVIGVFSLFGYLFGVEVDILFVTAVLTTLAFSVHDTIVVFDRIRELQRKHRGTDFETVIDTAVIETLGRSVNNSVTVILMLLALTLLGGETIRWFVTALLIGVVLGTYSSPFVAVPLLLTFSRFKKRLKR